MKKQILFLTFWLIVSTLFAQKSLLFLNTLSNQTIEVSLGNTLSAKYKGYNNQIYYYKNTVTEITDSSITLGFELAEDPLWAQKLTKNYEPKYKVIQIKDLIAFRRITPGRILAKSLTISAISLGAIFGSILLFEKGNLSTIQNMLISLGIGAVSSTFNAFILPDNPKNKITNGNWIISVRD